MTKLYQTTLIVNGILEDVNVEEAISKFQETITKNGGELVSINRWGRRRLTYPIKKKSIGYYAIVEFNAPNELPKEMEKFFHLEENILRHLTLVVTKKMIQQKAFKPFVYESEVKTETKPQTENLPITKTENTDEISK